MKSLQEQIGINLKNVRKMRQYSLDQLSAVTGVSKGMLAQIEKGQSSPTVNTLWKIANGLGVSFSSLVEEEQTSVAVVRRADKTAVQDLNELYNVFSYFPYDQHKKFEIFLLELLPGCKHVSEQHLSGVEEYLFVSEGEMSVSIGEVHYELKKGDSIKFTANREHVYENKADVAANCFLLIYYP
ncbi:XRE family transcriptional regulator [Metabacillus idriensis]|uniref:Helix-turn-helix domain-containing protein n=1 Tax=Metabacillus idriensis TaxID=324768 RepID=A0A6I2M3G6_9BACI|nr:XRE family transcriptional regulator [Metabacillus idriensis]MCM3595354.1 XRE family transcriptional regulator [Metabacillus idriensis]MRX52620.1 helix-turn-helix domain-containing protein [Metabacillus idriensis]OHR72275.1 hypothetical protein HMPREF3291_22300 [Bacillus sp. HMSC76G11]